MAATAWRLSRKTRASSFRGSEPAPVAPLAGNLPVAVVGAKAANLAAAAAARLPVLEGFVVTTEGAEAIEASGGVVHAPAALLRSLRHEWEALSCAGSRPLVVRSSSPGEDGATSSMAGHFHSALDVRGWAAFAQAVDEVIASRHLAGDRHLPMAVLVQPFVLPRVGGVLFGADVVSGRPDRLTVAAVQGGPDHLVSGEVDGAHLTLTLGGRLVKREGDGDVELARHDLRRLAALARRAATVFGGPQDIEWAIEPDGRLLLLQSRPLTSVAAQATGPLLGPGPVAETFPDPLATLEQDLWVEPLRDGLRAALALAGAVPARRLRSSPLVVVVGGRVAVDLDLLSPRRARGLARLDPRPPARRLRASWRIGRLREALPALARDAVETTDRELESVPPLAGASPATLLRILGGTRRALVALHGQEVLAGMLLAPPAAAETGAVRALHALAAGRAEGLDDRALVHRHPDVLALVPPRIGPAVVLPVQTPSVPDLEAVSLAPREALRLRVRWLHELSAQAAWRIGIALRDRGAIDDPELVRWLRLDELEEMVQRHQPAPDALADRRHAAASAPPLPSAFRLDERGRLVAEEAASSARAAGGGRGSGVVVHASADPPPPGAVLVTRTLDPALASWLPGLGGLVSETGSVLSHLAIVARELGIPTVVGYHDALQQLPAGVVAVVDGTSGEVTIAGEAP